MSVHILFVDDEMSVLNSLRRVFRGFKEYEYHFASSPIEATGILAQQDITVLVSDHKMPQMAGIEFLSLVKEKRPDTVRILLTGQADLEAVQQAVNSGEVFRFFLKPWNDDDLRSAVEQAVAFHSLISENRRLTEITQEQNLQLTSINAQLEDRVETRTRQLADALLTARTLNEQLTQGLFAGTKALFNIIRLARPELGSHSKRVADGCVAVGKAVGLQGERLAYLEMAALLHDCGKLGLPSFIMEKHPGDFSPQERELYRSHPMMGAEFLRGVSQYEPICSFIVTHHERLNGTGFPSGLQRAEIPQEGLIIGIVNEYDHLMNRPNHTSEFNYQYTCQKFAEYSDRDYPQAVVQAVLDCAATIDNSRAGSSETRIGLAELSPNLTLARDVYSMSGHLLLSAGTALTAQNIARLRAIAKVDPLAGEIAIVTSSNRSFATKGA